MAITQAADRARAWRGSRQAADLGVRNPRAMFGAGLLFILTLYAVVLLMMLPVRA